jgi:hypothetical protein
MTRPVRLLLPLVTLAGLLGAHGPAAADIAAVVTSGSVSAQSAAALAGGGSPDTKSRTLGPADFPDGSGPRAEVITQAVDGEEGRSIGANAGSSANVTSGTSDDGLFFVGANLNGFANVSCTTFDDDPAASANAASSGTLTIELHLDNAAEGELTGSVRATGTRTILPPTPPPSPTATASFSVAGQGALVTSSEAIITDETEVTGPVRLPAGVTVLQLQYSVSGASFSGCDQGKGGNGSVEVDLTLREECATPSVSPFKQFDSPWGTETYDNSSQTVAAKGCALTSLSMALNTAGQTTLTVGGEAKTNDPGTLNQLMKDNPGSFYGSSVSWGPATLNASGNTLEFVAQRIASTTDDAGARRFVKGAVCAGYPVIVGVNLSAAGTPGHYILVTGVEGDDFTIADPGPEKTLLSEYPAFETRGFVAPPGTPVPGTNAAQGAAGTDRSAVYVAAGPGVSLLVTDPQGRRSGVDPTTGNTLAEIPGSTRFVDRLDDDETGTPATEETEAVYVDGAVDGTYTVQASSRAGGPFEITVHTRDRAGALREPTFLSGEGQAGQTTTFDVEVATAPGEACALACRLDAAEAACAADRRGRRFAKKIRAVEALLAKAERKPDKRTKLLGKVRKAMESIRRKSVSRAAKGKLEASCATNVDVAADVAAEAS